jgi:hypothetical protein
LKKAQGETIAEQEVSYDVIIRAEIASEINQAHSIVTAGVYDLDALEALPRSCAGAGATSSNCSRASASPLGMRSKTSSQFGDHT